MEIRKPKFTFREIVEIHSPDPSLQDLNGTLGRISGISEADTPGRPHHYGVFSFVRQLSVYIAESELISTGQFSDENIYDGTDIRVRVNERGEGTIVSDDNEERRWTP